ncbi:MAG: hypothetical protein HPY50_12910 [Firmicutes bacterium]|nr:hypothetical protein [Bacillota bacterium]
MKLDFDSLNFLSGVSAAVFIISVFTHLLSFFGVKIFSPVVLIMFFIIIILGFPAQYAIARLLNKSFWEPAWNWFKAMKGCPRWMSKLNLGLLIYTITVFLGTVFLEFKTGKYFNTSWQILLSCFCLFLSFAFLSVFYSASKVYYTRELFIEKAVARIRSSDKPEG